MKKLLPGILIFISLQSVAQKTIAATDSFTVEGTVKQSRSFSLQDLADLPMISIDSIVISNHLKARRHAIKNIKGVLLKDVLGKITIDQENVKILSEYYIVCIASDNYKAVFSWNEIFNNETGRHVLIITEQDGKKGASLDGRIAIISPTDDATGRRYVKGLQKIIIERVK
ncbi:MAG: molybdopterin-binding protein [Ferruginibacter sp.]